MRISADIYKPSPEVCVEHNGQKLFFSATVFTREPFTTPYDIFTEINQYWASLPMHEQDAIFAIYDRVNAGFDQMFTSELLDAHLRQCIHDLLRYHDLDRLEVWIMVNPSIIIPSDIPDDFVDSIDSNMTSEKTYVKKDFLRLITLSLFMRTLVPIWGEYVKSIRREVGTDFKIYTAFQLLRDTPIMTSPAIERLKVYIRSMIGDKNSDPNKIMDGISSEDFWIYLLASTCVRRLCTADISGTNTDKHLAMVIYKYLYQKIFNPNSRKGGIEEKEFGGKETASNERGITDSYRRRTELSFGEIKEMEKAFSNVIMNAERLAPGIDHALVYSCLNTAQQLEQQVITDLQLFLVSWVFRPIISPRAIYYMPKPIVVKALGTLEAVLWQWGHRYLSILATCYPVTSNETMTVASMDSKNQIPKEMVEQILEVYPFVGSTMKWSTETETPEQSPVINEINAIVNLCFTYVWSATAADAHIEHVLSGKLIRRYPIPPSIKRDFAKLIIDIGNRRFVAKSKSINPEAYMHLDV